jgi:hypothetical protein
MSYQQFLVTNKLGLSARVPNSTIDAFTTSNMFPYVYPVGFVVPPHHGRFVYGIVALNHILPSRDNVLSLGAFQTKFNMVHADKVYTSRITAPNTTQAIDIGMMPTNFNYSVSNNQYNEIIAWRFLKRSNVMDFVAGAGGGRLDARDVSCTSLTVGGVRVQDMDAVTLMTARAYTDEAIRGIVSSNVAMTNHILPAAHNTFDIGSVTRRFANVHARRLATDAIVVDPAAPLEIRTAAQACWLLKPIEPGRIDIESRGGNIVIGANTIAGSNIQCSNITVSGSIVMGASATNQSANKRIVNLAYGLGDLDACPKRQIAELDAMTLSNARAYTDQRMINLTPGGAGDVSRNIVPEANGTLDLGSAERRFKECHALKLLALQVEAGNVTAQHIAPPTSVLYDLGTAARKFRDCHVQRVFPESIVVPENNELPIRTRASSGSTNTSWNFRPKAGDTRNLDLESTGGNLLMPHNNIAASNVECARLAVSGTLMMGASATDRFANKRIVNLAYGLNDLDACPKKQIEDFCANTLAIARVYTDQRVSAVTPNFGDFSQSVLPSTNVAYDLGSAEKNFRTCHAWTVQATQINSTQINCSGGIRAGADISTGGDVSANVLRGNEINFTNNRGFSESNVGPFCSPTVTFQRDVIAHVNVTPAADNLRNLGQARLRYKNVFASSVKTNTICSESGTPVDVGTFDPITAAETVSWRFQPGRGGVLDLVSVSGSLVMGASATDSFANQRIANLAYGLNDLDACPKKQVEEISAATLIAAKAYTDQAVSGTAPGGGESQNIWPAANDAYDIGSVGSRFRECHANRAFLNYLRVSGSVVMGPSGTDQSANSRIQNLGYGVSDLDACPKQQVEDISASTLVAAKAYTDAALTGNFNFEDIRCNDIFATGRIECGGDLSMGGYKIGNLQYGSDDFNACPKKQIEEMVAAVLRPQPSVSTDELRLKTDQGYVRAFDMSNVGPYAANDIIAHASIAPSGDDVHSLGRAELRYKDLFVKSVNAGAVSAGAVHARSLRCDPVDGLAVTTLDTATSNETAWWRFAPAPNGMNLVPNEDIQVDIGTIQKRVKTLHASSIIATNCYLGSSEFYHISVEGTSYLNGEVRLMRAPTEPVHATNKFYVDTKTAGDIAPADNALRDLGNDTRRYRKCFVNDVNLGEAFPSLLAELVSLRQRLEALNG